MYKVYDYVHFQTGGDSPTGEGRRGEGGFPDARITAHDHPLVSVALLPFAY